MNPRGRPRVHTDRNAKIVERAVAGENMQAIADAYTISRARVEQIVRAAGVAHRRFSTRRVDVVRGTSVMLDAADYARLLKLATLVSAPMHEVLASIVRAADRGVVIRGRRQLLTDALAELDAIDGTSNGGAA